MEVHESCCVHMDTSPGLFELFVLIAGCICFKGSKHVVHVLPIIKFWVAAYPTEWSASVLQDPYLLMMYTYITTHLSFKATAYKSLYSLAEMFFQL